MQLRQLAFFSIVVMISIPSWAGEVFGPKTYTLANGRPQLASETIVVTDGDRCSGKASFLLIMENGDGRALSQVTSGEIVVDGMTIAGESDFQRRAPRIAVPVRLRSSTPMVISLKGGHPGAFIRVSVIRVIGEDLFPPRRIDIASKSNSATQTFTAPGTGPLFLTLQNGDETGLHRVKGGSITLNGVPLAAIDRKDGLVRVPIVAVVTNELRIDIEGQSGDFVIVGVQRQLDESACSGMSVIIVSPSEDEIVASPWIVVRGTAIGPLDPAILVNGNPADIAFGHAGTSEDPYEWVAVIQAEPGQVTLSVELNAAGNETRLVERHLTFAPEAETIRLRATPSSGVSPFPAVFDLDVLGGREAVLYELDLDGDGVFERSSPTFPENLDATFSTPGIFVPAVRVTASDGSVLSGKAVVLAQSLPAMDALVRRTWNAFLAELSQSDIEGALALLSSDAARKRYRGVLEAVRAELPAYAASISAIHPEKISGTVAHYLIVRQHNGRNLGYRLSLVRCSDGVWRIAQF